MDSPDLKAFFPGHLLETGGDIIFFWVARMVMMSLELTDKLPFETVFFHPMVKDEVGSKMSKSKGNVIDPLEVIDSCTLKTLVAKIENSTLPPNEQKKSIKAKTAMFPEGIPACGTDALRFTMLAYMVQSSINLDVKRVVGYKEFCNKIWNVNKFAHFNFPEGFVANPAGVASMQEHLSLSDKWILTRLSKVIKSSNQNFEDYKFGDMVQDLYDFWWKELCDVYTEVSKPQLKTGSAQQQEATLNTLYTCLDVGLRLLSPTMPFLTEELY